MANDIYTAAREALDISYVRERAFEVMSILENALTRPSVLYRPSLTQDGDAWVALYGEDLATGVVGTGKTPDDAMAAFDRAWLVK